MAVNKPIISNMKFLPLKRYIGLGCVIHGFLVNPHLLMSCYWSVTLSILLGTLT